MHKTDVKLDNGWPCEGALLDLARQAAEKLLPGILLCSEFHKIDCCNLLYSSRKLQCILRGSYSTPLKE